MSNSRAQVKPATREPSRSAAGAKGLSAAVVAQRKTTMAVLHSVAEMLGRAVGPNVEAVVHDLVGDLLHATVGVVDDEEFARAEQPVRDDQRADGVITGAATSVADYVRVALLEAEDAVGVDA